MKFTVADLEQKILDLLKTRGFSDADAAQIVAPIMWAETHGNKQGLLKLIGEPGLQKDTGERPISIDKESASTANFDGGEHNAMLVAQAMIIKAVELLENSGVVAIGSHATHSSSGALTYYIEQLAAKGYVAIMMCRTPPFMVPFKTIEPLFGTNPFAISYPSKDGPLSFDMATAAAAFYNLLVFSTEGKKIDPRLFIDSAGQPTDDPAKVIDGGATLPFDGGYKSSALGMMVELLAGPLVGGAFCDDTGGEWGHLLIAIDPDNFVGRDAFAEKVSAAVAKIRSTPTSDGKPVQLPGDHSRKVHDAVQASGEIDIPENILEKLGWK